MSSNLVILLNWNSDMEKTCKDFILYEESILKKDCLYEFKFCELDVFINMNFVLRYKNSQVFFDKINLKIYNFILPV